MAFPRGVGTKVPMISTYPVIIGANVVGSTLTVTPGVWTATPTSRSYQWQNEGSNIGGATGTTYLLQTSDLGCIITVNEIASNGAGSSDPARSGLFGPVISATAFYVSNSVGNDSWNGTAPAFVSGTTGPWKTTNKLNSQTFPAGTSVLFKRGDKWDRAAGIGVTTMISPNGGGTSGNPVVYDAYGTGNNPILDGSIDKSLTSDWQATGTTNVWQSVAQFIPTKTFSVSYSGTNGNPLLITWGTQTPANTVAVMFASTGSIPPVLSTATTYYVINVSGATFNVALTPGGAAINSNGSFGSGTQTGGSNGRPYWDANDVGNILWGFTAVGGSAPSTVMDASFGKMTGNGTGGVWYKGGDGTANIGTTQGNWNFNTDNWRVQIYSVGNPATTMPGLRLAIDGGLFKLTNDSYITIQNLTLQYSAAGSAFPLLGTFSNIIIRDNVIQWIGGANNGGKSDADARIGDAVNPEGTYTNILMERNWCHQIYDNCFSPQLFSAGAHDASTVRNNVFYHCDKAIDLEPTNLASSTMNGINIYNNTTYAYDSWSSNQRPNGGAGRWGFESFDSGSLVMSNLKMENNVFAGIILHGILIHSPLQNTFTDFAPVIINYNCWRLNSGTGIFIANPGITNNVPMTTWKSAGTFEQNGLIDVDPQFTGVSNFNPAPSSPLRSAGANLTSVGVVWDFNKNPRPGSGSFTIGAFQ